MEKDPLKDIQKKLAFSQLMVVYRELYSLIGKGGSLYNSIYSDILLLIISLFNISIVVLNVYIGNGSIIDLVLLTLTFLYIARDVLTSFYYKIGAEENLGKVNLDLLRELLTLNSDSNDNNTKDKSSHREENLYKSPSIVTLLSNYDIYIKLSYVGLSFIIHFIGFCIILF